MKTDSPKNQTDKESKLTALFKKLAFAATFFSIIYAISLTLSISYNVGYFKQLNPQLVDLMDIGDYIDDTIHNLWFFLLAALLCFSSSLAWIGKRKKAEFYKLLIFGIIALITSSYFFLKGVYYSKFWLALRKITLNESTFLYLGLIALIILGITYVIFRVVSNIARHDLSSYTLVILPLIVFFSIVFMPYLGGMMQGYVENKVMHTREFSVHKVTIILVNNENLDDVIILKKLNKGLLVKQFKEDSYKGDKFISFINWGIIKYITYGTVID